MMITRLKQLLFVMLVSTFLLLVLVTLKKRNFLKLLLMKTAFGSLEDSQPLMDSNKKWSKYDLDLTSVDLSFYILGNVCRSRITMYRSRSWFSLHARFLWLYRISQFRNRSRMAHFNFQIIPNRTNCHSNCSYSSKFLNGPLTTVNDRVKNYSSSHGENLV